MKYKKIICAKQLMRIAMHNRVRSFNHNGNESLSQNFDLRKQRKRKQQISAASSTKDPHFVQEMTQHLSLSPYPLLFTFFFFNTNNTSHNYIFPCLNKRSARNRDLGNSKNDMSQKLDSLVHPVTHCSQLKSISKLNFIFFFLGQDCRRGCQGH